MTRAALACAVAASVATGAAWAQGFGGAGTGGLDGFNLDGVDGPGRPGTRPHEFGPIDGPGLGPRGLDFGPTRPGDDILLSPEITRPDDFGLTPTDDLRNLDPGGLSPDTTFEPGEVLATPDLGGRDIDVSRWRALGNLATLDPQVLDLIERGLATPDQWQPRNDLDTPGALGDFMATPDLGHLFMPAGPDDFGPVVSGIGDIPVAVINPDGDTPTPVGTVSGATAAAVCRDNPWDMACRGLIRVHDAWDQTDSDPALLSPVSIDTEAIRPALTDAILDMAVFAMAGAGGGLTEADDGSVTLRNIGTERCDDTSIRPLHCGAMLTADGRQAVTAFHCLRNLARPFPNDSETDALSLAPGDAAICGPESRFRLVTGAVFGDDSGAFPASAVRRCASVRRVSEDIAVFTLDQPVLRSRVSPALLDSPPDPDSVVQGRRVLSLGFPQVVRLRQSAAGFIAENRMCGATFEQIGQPLAADGAGDLGFASYLCTSADSYQGSSGGPALVVSEDGATLHLIGVMSRAISGSIGDECGTSEDAPEVSDDLASDETRLNLIAIGLE